jgi:tRNA(fMet)-specific endonuclease VapC
MAVLIDTRLLIDRERSGRLAERLSDEDVAISVITVSELLQGVERAVGEQRVRRQAVVEQILSAFEPIPITTAVARVHAGIWADLATRGRMIGAHDLWIAATALAHGFGVATLNRDEFARVPGLRLVMERDEAVPASS